METYRHPLDQFNKQAKQPGILCSVCIATYRRPMLLEKLLVSLRNQKLPEDVTVEIIIVDNDLQKSAEPVVHEFQKSTYLKIFYFDQPIKSISLTRNLAVEKASGEYILFIDDDEIASVQWIYYLWKTINKFRADGVFGPVIYEINGNNLIKMQYINFNTVSHTGARAISKWTGNCMIRAALLKELKEPFDSRYGTTGGEDTFLFGKLEKRGAHFVYCKEAIVTEYWPEFRTRSSYLFLRGLQGGNLHTRRVIEFAEIKSLIRLSMLFKSVFYGISSLFMMVIFSFGEARRTYWLMKLGSNLGRFLSVFGWHYKGYR